MHDYLPGMEVRLLPHQLIGVSWMVDQERNTPHKGGILADDMGLPRTFKLKKVADQAFDVAPTTETSGEKSYSRTLDSDEVRGIWLLFGLLAGSWLAAGALQPSSAYAQKAEEVVDEAVEKVKGEH